MSHNHPLTLGWIKYQMILKDSIGSSYLPQRMFSSEALYRRGKKHFKKDKSEKLESNIKDELRQN